MYLQEQFESTKLILKENTEGILKETCEELLKDIKKEIDLWFVDLSGIGAKTIANRILMTSNIIKINMCNYLM
jgi:hypothetical protein